MWDDFPLLIIAIPVGWNLAHRYTILKTPGTDHADVFRTWFGHLSIDCLATCKRDEEVTQMLSARNQFQGTVKEVKLGNVMAEVIVSVGDLEIASAITRASAERLGLKPGDAVNAVIKSTDVLIDK